MSEISVQAHATPKPIPQGLPDKPGPKLVSEKGKVERLVVVLDDDANLEAATERVLKEGNVPAVVVTGGLMTWSGNGYIGFSFISAAELGIYVGTFNDQGLLELHDYRAQITEHQVK